MNFSRVETLIVLATLTVDLFTAGVAFGQEQAPFGVITLQDTVAKFVQNDALAKKYKLEWMATDADVDQLLNSEGWALELGGRKEVVEGNRLETRNSSMGRDPRRDYDSITERENYLMLGLSNSFLEEVRRRKSDAEQEKIKRLEDVRDFDLAFRESTLNAALAFSGAYYDRLGLELAKKELAIEEESLRVIEAKVAQEAAVRLDEIGVRTKITSVQSKVAELTIKLKRKMDYLRDLWGYPDLEPEMLAEPDLPESTDLTTLEVSDLVEWALGQRDDLESIVKAKQSHIGSADLNKALPEVDFTVSSRYGHYDRDFSDEGRHESTYDIRLDLEVSIPLSLKRRNEARTRRFNLDTKAREYEILAKQDEIREEISEAFEDFLLAHEEIKVQKALLHQAIENERMTRLTVETLPETIKGDPEQEFRQIVRDRLQIEGDYVMALRDRVESTLILLSLLGELSPDYREIVDGKIGLE